MAEKVTVMVLKVDLQCPSCYKKIKKILCKFPQEIRGQTYDVKQNTVKISVVCCSPEKFRDKLCCKGGKVIESIEIIKEPEKKPSKDPKQVNPNGDSTPADQKPTGKRTKPDTIQGPPARTCCGPCSEGYVGGPCYHGYPAPPPCYYVYYGYGYGCGCGCGRGCHHLGRSVCYIEENPSACKIM